MAIRNIQELPTDLPPSRLFLGDIEEILAVFRDCASPPIEGKSRNEESVTYRLGNRVCDTTEDLLKIGGRTAHLDLTYRVWQAVDKDGNENQYTFPTTMDLHMSRYGSSLRHWAAGKKLGVSTVEPGHFLTDAEDGCGR